MKYHFITTSLAKTVEVLFAGDENLRQTWLSEDPTERIPDILAKDAPRTRILGGDERRALLAHHLMQELPRTYVQGDLSAAAIPKHFLLHHFVDDHQVANKTFQDESTVSITYLDENKQFRGFTLFKLPDSTNQWMLCFAPVPTNLEDPVTVMFSSEMVKQLQLSQLPLQSRDTINWDELLREKHLAALANELISAEQRIDWQLLQLLRVAVLAEVSSDFFPFLLEDYKNSRANTVVLDEQTLNAHFQKLNDALEALKKEIDKLYGQQARQAAEVAEKLYKKLTETTRTYANKDFHLQQYGYTNFRVDCLRAIDRARPILERHRGWKEFLYNLAALILLTPVLYAACWLGKTAYTRRIDYLFKPKTRSSEILQQLDETLQNFRP